MKRMGLLALALILCAGCGAAPVEPTPTPAPTLAATPAPTPAHTMAAHGTYWEETSLQTIGKDWTDHETHLWDMLYLYRDGKLSATIRYPRLSDQEEDGPMADLDPWYDPSGQPEEDIWDHLEYYPTGGDPRQITRNFYLTEDQLVLILSFGRNQTRIAAPLDKMTLKREL